MLPNQAFDWSLFLAQEREASCGQHQCSSVSGRLGAGLNVLHGKLSSLQRAGSSRPVAVALTAPPSASLPTAVSSAKKSLYLDKNPERLGDCCTAT